MTFLDFWFDDHVYCQGYLKHVWNVLGRAGYTRVDMNTTSAWDVLWAHDYPFKKIREKMLAIKPGQKVNKFPGSGYITNKVHIDLHREYQPSE